MEIAQDRSADALYRTGFLCVDLPFQLKGDIAEYSQQELGTFLHEYVHFLQNMTTPWGLYESARLYEQIAAFFSQLSLEYYPIIYAPVEEEYVKTHNSVIEILKYGRGVDRDISNREVYSLKFAEETQFRHHRKLHKIKVHTVPEIRLEFNTQYGTTQILFGAWFIKESMAAMIQEKVDPTSPSRHADVPYNIVKRYAVDMFPAIASDNDKLIAICYASLFSLSPADEFINLASHANDHPEYSVDDILTSYFSRPFKASLGSSHFDDFYRNISARFLTVVSKLLLTGSRYIANIIHATQFCNQSLPLLAFLNSKVDAALIKEILSHCGWPAVIGSGDSGIFPHLEGDADSQKEIVLLLGYETLYKFLTTNPPTCPRLSQCIAAGLDVSSCSSTPWDRSTRCPMTEVSAFLKISDKHIIKK